MQLKQMTYIIVYICTRYSEIKYVHVVHVGGQLKRIKPSVASVCKSFSHSCSLNTIILNITVATFAMLAIRMPSLFSHPTFIIAFLLLRNLNIDSAISTTTATRISRGTIHAICIKKNANAVKKRKENKKKRQAKRVKSSPTIRPLAKRFSELCNSSRKYQINTHSLIIT